MAYKIIKDGGGESDPLVNKMMTTDEVKLLIRQILSESTDFEMELGIVLLRLPNFWNYVLVWLYHLIQK